MASASSSSSLSAFRPRLISSRVYCTLPISCEAAVHAHMGDILPHDTDEAYAVLDTALTLLEEWQAAAAAVRELLSSAPRSMLRYVVVGRRASAVLAGVEYQYSSLVVCGAQQPSSSSSSRRGSSLLSRARAAMGEMHRVSVALEGLFVEYASRGGEEAGSSSAAASGSPAMATAGKRRREEAADADEDASSSSDSSSDDDDEQHIVTSSSSSAAAAPVRKRARREGDAARRHKRAARVLVCTRDGAVYEQHEEASLMAAVRRVYAAMDASVVINGSCAQYRHIQHILATSDGRGGKIYTHPVPADADDATLHYMIQYACDSVPDDGEEAYKWYCNWST